MDEDFADVINEDEEAVIDVPEYARELWRIVEEVRSGKQKTYPLSKIIEECGL